MPARTCSPTWGSVAVGDPRPEGRDAVAVITALLPIYTAEEQSQAEAAAAKVMPTLIAVLGDKDARQMLTVLTHLGHIAASMAVRINPEDPYEVVRELAKNHT